MKKTILESKRSTSILSVTLLLFSPNYHHFSLCLFFSPILLSDSDLKRNLKIPYYSCFFFFFFSLPFKVKNSFRSVRYKSFITDKTWRDEKELLQKFLKEHLERYNEAPGRKKKKRHAKESVSCH